MEGGVFPFQYFSCGILDRVKVSFDTADSHTGKQWRGVGNARSGPAQWVFFDESPPWGLGGMQSFRPQCMLLKICCKYMTSDL